MIKVTNKCEKVLKREILEYSLGTQTFLLTLSCQLQMHQPGQQAAVSRHMQQLHHLDKPKACAIPRNCFEIAVLHWGPQKFQVDALAYAKESTRDFKITTKFRGILRDQSVFSLVLVNSNNSSSKWPRWEHFLRMTIGAEQRHQQKLIFRHRIYTYTVEAVMVTVVIRLRWNRNKIENMKTNWRPTEVIICIKMAMIKNWKTKYMDAWGDNSSTWGIRKSRTGLEWKGARSYLVHLPIL